MLKNMMRVLFSNVWVAAIGLVSTLVFPKIMSMDSYAEYQTFTLYLSYIAILHLGIPSGMFVKYAGKEYQSIDRREYKTEITAILLILTFFTGVGLGIYAFTQSRMVLYVSAVILPYCYVGSYNSLYQSWNMFKEFSIIRMIIPTATTVVALFLFFATGSISSDAYIIINILTYAMVGIVIYCSYHKFVAGVKCEKFVSEKNMILLKTGFLLVIGNYINNLFHAIDKQFIKWFFTNIEFATYSFAVTLQSVMTMVITSIAQPLFPQMAKGGIDKEKYCRLKELLFLFGSMAGCAYFACALIVDKLLPNYRGSIRIIGLFFAIFPAMAVINCLYINLYKLDKKLSKYIISLLSMLVVAAVLNLAGVLLFENYEVVAVATTITYYVWLIFSTKDFPFLRLTLRDYGFLTVYLILFYLLTQWLNNLLGMLLYVIAIPIIAILFYGCYLSQYKTLLKFR